MNKRRVRRLITLGIYGFCALGVLVMCTKPAQPDAKKDQSAPEHLVDVKVTAPVPKLDDWTSFTKTVQPFFIENCASCHGEVNPENGIRLNNFTDEAALEKQKHVLTHALKMLRERKMPPSDQKQPSTEQLKPVVVWLDAFALRVEAEDLKNPGHVTMRRLNRAEYNNTVRDLLGVEIKPADAFPEDDAGHGFDNNGDVLTLAPVLMEKYLAAAELCLDRAIMVKAAIPPPMKTIDAATVEGTLPKGTPRVQGAGNSNVGANNARGREFPYSGEIYVDEEFQQTGHYFLRVRAYGAAGQAPGGGGGRGGAGAGRGGAAPRPQVVFKMDGVEVDKPVVVSSDFAQTSLFSIENPIKIAAGKHRITLSFINGPTKEEAEAAAEVAALAADAAAVAAQKAATLDALEQGLEPPVPGAVAQGNGRGRGFGGGGGGRGQQGSPTGKPTLGIVWIEAEGPIDPSLERMPEGFRKIFPVLPSETVTRADAAKRVISSFATKAYRRPVTDAEMTRLMAYWSANEVDETFEKSISVALQPVLASPNFLYRVEGEPSADAGVRDLTEYELASRLSYFLWSSMPDDELMKLAGEKKLRANLKAQVSRMLADPKAFAFCENFAGQWLQLRKVNTVVPDTGKFPEFDDALRSAMLKETQLFVSAVITEDRSVLDFIDADFTYVNQRLAKHYGIPDVLGDDFRRVSLAGTERGGLLTQASVLTITSYPNRTSPVQRGKWVLENLLDSAPPPPPPNVPTLEESAKTKSKEKASLRQIMEDHRQNPNCITCHSVMDPIGFGLENFNAVGTWRDTDPDADNQKIDASGKLGEGQNFVGPTSLKKLLMGRKDEFVECLVDRTMTYALGRGMEPQDRPRIKMMAAALKKEDYKFSALIMQVVMSDPFQKQGTKRSE